MSDCCAIEGSAESCATMFSEKSATAKCLVCGTEGRPVEQQTVVHHVKHEHLDRVNGEAFRFCPDPKCEVVYYGDHGTRFSVDDLRELVTAKATGDRRPICYCFGFTEGDARKEIVRTGTSSIPATVSRLIKARMCACEVQNPAGVCCLGQVNRTIKQLSVQQPVPSEVERAAVADCCAREERS